VSTTPAIRWWCHVENDSVPFAVRWRELAELAAVVGAALLIHAFLQPADRGPAGAWLHVAVQLAVPLGAAWTLRRSVGARAFVTAAILDVGLVAARLVSPTATQELPTQSMVAAGVVWVLGGDPRPPMWGVLVGATIIALAFAVAAFI